MTKTAVIIGAGPAGLTAAYELLKQTDIHPIILEKDDMVGGLSRTVNFPATEWTSAATASSLKAMRCRTSGTPSCPEPRLLPWMTAS